MEHSVKVLECKLHRRPHVSARLALLLPMPWEVTLWQQCFLEQLAAVNCCCAHGAFVGSSILQSQVRGVQRIFLMKHTLCKSDVSGRNITKDLPAAAGLPLGPTTEGDMGHPCIGEAAGWKGLEGAIPCICAGDGPGGGICDTAGLAGGAGV